MLNNLKASVLRWWEMGWPARTQLKAWLKDASSFNVFDPETFSNPSLRVATVSNANGKTVAYCLLETCFVIRGYAVSPEVSEEEVCEAGCVVDEEIERYGQQAGISKVLTMVPKSAQGLSEGDFKEVRVYEKPILNRVNTHLIEASTPSHMQYIN